MSRDVPFDEQGGVQAEHGRRPGNPKTKKEGGGWFLGYSEIFRAVTTGDCITENGDFLTFSEDDMHDAPKYRPCMAPIPIEAESCNSTSKKKIPKPLFSGSGLGIRMMKSKIRVIDHTLNFFTMASN
ncbi:MAG: hypothetical protein AB7E77_07030 [Desulfobulbus sp.]